jgi:hypothetical protein
MSRWENAPSLREVIRLMRAMVDLYCASYPKPPAAVTLDIDDTVDVVHERLRAEVADLRRTVEARDGEIAGLKYLIGELSHRPGQKPRLPKLPQHLPGNA